MPDERPEFDYGEGKTRRQEELDSAAMLGLVILAVSSAIMLGLIVLGVYLLVRFA